MAETLGATSLLCDAGLNDTICIRGRVDFAGSSTRAYESHGLLTHLARGRYSLHPTFRQASEPDSRPLTQAADRQCRTFDVTSLDLTLP